MYDWNHDGKEDVMDYVFYEEMIENHDDFNSDDDDFGVGGYSGGSTNTYSGKSNTTRNTYTPARNTSTGVPVFARFLIVAVIAMLVGIFSELLGFIILIAWIYIELMG